MLAGGSIPYGECRASVNLRTARLHELRYPDRNCGEFCGDTRSSWVALRIDSASFNVLVMERARQDMEHG